MMLSNVIHRYFAMRPIESIQEFWRKRELIFLPQTQANLLP